MGRTDSALHSVPERMDGQAVTLLSLTGISIRANNRLGRHFIPVGGVFDGTYPTSKTRRGRVQGGGYICPTITAYGELYLLVQAEEEIL